VLCTVVPGRALRGFFQHAYRLPIKIVEDLTTLKQACLQQAPRLASQDVVREGGGEVEAVAAAEEEVEVEEVEEDAGVRMAMLEVLETLVDHTGDEEAGEVEEEGDQEAPEPRKRSHTPPSPSLIRKYPLQLRHPAVRSKTRPKAKSALFARAQSFTTPLLLAIIALVTSAPCACERYTRTRSARIAG
jgi:hypothetical protein